ncbi:kinase domain protein (macronuclear) [Tetrahymena thermophila SB210]|uniref:Kinase domain protein n=1 Tax=Tetrahymena thermophila (strain SB210) TaxID=312017 RepID=I7M204_TETTS|nr:kinase domain protein [Tetrahymena thermophila SB210]EAR98228.2 kinase domain protein [Tetrahymena thermophila SB210]|eukprot:XP_001018473.2 kinase domain protein [Tetrahymena thermophila SB210]
MESVCTALTKCSDLQKVELYFGNNCIDNKGIADLTASLESQTKISTLLLNFYLNNIGELGAQCLSNCLMKFKQLQNLELNLGYNHIGKIGAQSILSALAHCTNLSTLSLDLKHNKIFASNLDQQLCLDLTSYENQLSLKLSLEYNSSKQFYQNQQGELGFAINFINSSIIRSLDLGIYSINDQEAYKLGSILANCNNLETLTLNLKDNYLLQAQGAQNLFSALSCSQTLQSLTLMMQQVKIGNEGLVSLSNFLSKCHLLSKLNLYFNLDNIGLQSIQSFQHSLSICSNLSDIVLELAQMEKEGIFMLGNAFGNCENLSKIDINLDYNQINDEDIEKFSQSLIKCSKLSWLHLSLIENSFGLKGAQKLYENLVLCTNLSSLYLKLGRNQHSEGDLDGEQIDFDSLTHIIASSEHITLYDIRANQYFY